MFETAFNNIDNALWKDSGCDGELDYIEQTSWVLFLKYLHDLEQERRVFYVAITRAKERLTLITTSSIAGKYCAPSPYIKEMELSKKTTQ